MNSTVSPPNDPETQKPNVNVSEPEHASAETATRFSKGMEALLDVQKSNLDAAANLAAESANLFSEGVETFVGAQKSVLDAAAESVHAATNVSQRAFALWNRAFWLAFGAPAGITAELSERADLLRWKQQREEESRRERERREAA